VVHKAMLWAGGRHTSGIRPTERRWDLDVLSEDANDLGILASNGLAYWGAIVSTCRV
jgi:hypothetical protein